MAGYTDQQLLDAGFDPKLLPIIRRESGGKSVGWEGLPGSKDYSPGGTDLSGYPLKSTGFPAWSGKKGPEGNSTAAGVAQIVGSTWDPIARKLGVTGFSLQDQARVANELYRESGETPWAAPKGSRLAEGVRPGEQTEGGTYVGVVHPTEDNGLSVGGALLLSGLLKNAYPEEAQQPTGNALLDGLIKGSFPGNEAAQPQQRQPGAQPQPFKSPVATPPATVPDLASMQVPSAAQSQSLPTIPGTQDNPLIQPGPGGAPVGARDVPGTLDRNRFSNPNQIAPYSPPGVPDDRMRVAGDVTPLRPGSPVAPPAGYGSNIGDEYHQLLQDEGGGYGVFGGGTHPHFQSGHSLDFLFPHGAANEASLLNRALRAINPIGSAQAGEMPRAAPAPAPAMPDMSSLPPSLAKLFAGPAQAEGAEAEVSTMMQPAAESLAEPVGVLAKDFIGKPIEAGVRGISGQSAPGTPQAIEDAVVGARLGMVGGPPGSLGAGLGRGVGAGRGVAERVEPTFGKAIEAETPGGRGAEPPIETPRGKAPPEPDLPPPPKVTRQEFDDDLHRSARAAEADMIEVNQLADMFVARGITKEQWQEFYHIRESRMTKRPLPETEDYKFVEQQLSDVDAANLHNAQWLYEHANDIYRSMPEAPLMTAGEGYVHRMVVGQRQPGEPLNPRETDPITGLGGGGLSRKASGAMHRDPDYVWEDNQGNISSQWGKLGASKRDPASYGETMTDQNGVKWTARQPTTRELMQHYPGRQYIDDLFVTTMNNFIRLSAVVRNAKILEKWKPRLQEEGLFYPEGAKLPADKKLASVHVPQMRGRADPMIADIANSMFDPRDPSWLEKLNKIVIGSMFWVPIRHELNVSAHYAVGRGFDNLYRNPMGLRAATAVRTLSPEYLRILRAGAGLKYASVIPETRNFTETLMAKLGHDIATAPEWNNVAKALGMKAADLARGVYQFSREHLWMVNDVFLTARVMELERAGKPLQEAIRIAEEEIPNYRLPTNSMTLRTIVQSPLVAFGRYDFARIRALAKTVQNLAGRARTQEERIRATGQALSLVIGGTAMYTIANRILQEAQKQLMPMMGDKTGKRILGDKPLEFSESGPFSVVREAARYGLSYMPKSVQQANIPIINQKIGALIGLEPEAEDWSKLVASIITAAPGGDLAMAIIHGGRDAFTGQKMTDPHKRLPAEIVQGAEKVAGELNPLGIGLQSLKKGLVPGLGPSFGIKQHYAGPPGKVLKMERSLANRSTARDPFQSGANQLYDAIIKQLGGGGGAVAPAIQYGAPRSFIPPPRQ